MKQKHIFLSITERCNLNCIYCFEKSKRPDSMSTETALSYIRRELYSEEPQHVTVDFLGGEPFLEFEKIKTICETVWEKQWKNSYNFYCVTNGTLVHGEIKQWLEKHSKQVLSNRRKPFMSTPADILKRVTKTVKVTNIAASFMSLSFMASYIYYDLSLNVFKTLKALLSTECHKHFLHIFCF